MNPWSIRTYSYTNQPQPITTQPFPMNNFNNNIENENFSGAELELNNKLRLYWREYLYWLRSVIVDMVFNVPELEAATKRLLSTSKDVSSTYGEYYGEEAARRFDQIFTNNLLITLELVRAIIANNPQVIETQKQNWTNNAQEIGQFYASINPAWNAEAFGTGLLGLMRSIEAMTRSMIEGNYERSIAQFDQMAKNQLVIINMIFEGIVQQFPNLFA